MALSFTPSKRPFERYPMEPNQRRKVQKNFPSAPQPSQFNVSPGSVVFRVLCPSSKSGSVIGKGGGIITKIRNETGAKIKLEEAVPGCDERVVVISGSAKDSDSKVDSGGIIPKIHNEAGAKIKLEETVPGCDEKVVVISGSEKDSDINVDGGEDGKASAEVVKVNLDASITEGSKSVKTTSLVQKALLLVFERIIEGVLENVDGDESSKASSPSIRLLIFSSQVGGLLGKGGSVIKQMSTNSGAQIRILPRDKVHLYAPPHDEIVQIRGGVDSIRKALLSVSQHLLENPPRDRDFHEDKPLGSSSHPYAPIPRPEAFNRTNYQFNEGPTPRQMPAAPKALVFRLLCSNDKVGSVIGKGGSIVKTLQHETGCEIKILETTGETKDRIIVINGPAHPDERISPPQDAVLRVQHRIFMAVPENKDNVALSRLLVSSNQTGCLLGKGGSIIEEMRKLSGAHIRVLSKDQIPKGVSRTENDEIVQVTGEFETVQEALLLITSRLRGHLFRDNASTLSHPAAHSAFLNKMPPFGSFMGRRETSPPRLYDGLPPFQKGAVRAHEEISAFTRAINSSSRVYPFGTERVIF